MSSPISSSSILDPEIADPDSMSGPWGSNGKAVTILSSRSNMALMTKKDSSSSSKKQRRQRRKMASVFSKRVPRYAWGDSNWGDVRSGSTERASPLPPPRQEEKSMNPNASPEPPPLTKPFIGPLNRPKYYQSPPPLAKPFIGPLNRPKYDPNNPPPGSPPFNPNSPPPGSPPFNPNSTPPGYRKSPSPNRLRHHPPKQRPRRAPPFNPSPTQTPAEQRKENAGIIGDSTPWWKFGSSDKKESRVGNDEPKKWLGRYQVSTRWFYILFFSMLWILILAILTLVDAIRATHTELQDKFLTFFSGTTVAISSILLLYILVKQYNRPYIVYNQRSEWTNM